MKQEENTFIFNLKERGVGEGLSARHAWLDIPSKVFCCCSDETSDLMLQKVCIQDKEIKQKLFIACALFGSYYRI